MLIKDLPVEDQDALNKCFYYPYSGYVYVYKSLLFLKDIETHSFHEILSKTVDGQDSISLSIVQAIHSFIDGLNGKHVLDVGCKIGYFSFLLYEFGAYVTGVESLELPCRVAEAIAKIRGCSIDFVHSTIQEYFSTSQKHFDLVVMLNVFDHILRAGEEQAWNLLNTVSERSPRMVLMMGPHGEVSGENIPDAVIKHSKYLQYKKLLSNSYGGRDLWGFTT